MMSCRAISTEIYPNQQDWSFLSDKTEKSPKPTQRTKKINGIPLFSVVAYPGKRGPTRDEEDPEISRSKETLFFLIIVVDTR
jgi:hypothetical protein